MPAFTPPTVAKTDLEFHELCRFVAQKDATSTWLTWVTGMVNGANVYALPANPGGVSLAVQSPKTATANVTTANANLVACDSAVLALAANPNRKLLLVQNAHTGAVFVKMGASVAANDAHYVLQGCTAADDGKGGSRADDIWTGPVWVLGQGAAGTNKVRVTEYT